MQVTRVSFKSCCGSMSLAIKIDRPLDETVLSFLRENGFKELPQFTKAGILYADSSELIVSGPFGGNRLNVKCKKMDCNQIFNKFETLLQQLE